MSASLLDRLSKRITIAAIALAIPLHLYVDPATGWTLRGIAALAFGAGLVCARRWPSLTPGVATAVAAVLPVFLATLVHVAALNVFYTVILAGLFGSLLPQISLGGWTLPAWWRVLLGTWALTISLAFPVMIVREAGLRLGTLRDTGALDSWALLTTPQVESWILSVVITQLVALLWLDWLYRPGSRIRDPGSELGSESNPESPIPNPVHGLWLGATLASLVAIYQGTVNMAFLNAGPWIGLRRAAGTLLDANAYGAIAALAGPLAFVSIPYLRPRHPRQLQAAALAINWAGAWMSGSRTGLLCGAFGTLLLVFELLRGSARDESASRDTSSLLAGIAVVVLLFIVGAGAIGPLQRIIEARSGSSMRELWTRGGYGTVATRMVRDYPLTGVGIGSFNWMAPDYWRTLANDRLPFDNAQNWWRHQVAELGLVASLPVILWSFLIAWLVLTRPTPVERRLETQTLRGLLIGIGAASLLGMPTQNPIVLLMFFSCVARFEMLTRPFEGRPEGRPLRGGGEGNRAGDEGRRGGPSGPPAAAWIAGFLVALGYAGGHLALARGPLKPLVRAARTNRDYITGTYPSERLPQGQFRWTQRHASFALAARSRHLVIRYHVAHPDVDTHPVQLRITTACQTLVDELRTDSAINAGAFELPEGEDRVVFETDVSRTWKPSDTGESDTRTLGAAIEADFIGTPDVVTSQDRWIPLKRCGPV
jgi:hypothetical protein